MEALFNILQSNLFLGLLVLLIVVPLYVKLGIIGKNSNGKNGTSNGTSQESINQNFRNDIKELYSHSSVANEEMGGVKIELAVMNTRLGGIEENIREIKNLVNK